MHITFDISKGQRKRLASALGLELNRDGNVCIEATVAEMHKLLLAARLLCLSKDEEYFLQSPDELQRPLNHRNEAAAVSWLLQQIASCSEDRTAELEQLQASLIDHCKPLWPEFANGDTVITGQKPPQAEFPGDDSPAAEFHAWAAQYGVCSAIQIASFGGLRGCAAVRDISPGDLILSIPQSALIYDDTVKQTDLGRMLMALPGLSMDNLLIIFTMCDRFDPDSAWAPFWRSLPDAFFTGLSFPPDLVGVLEGSAACLEMRRGQAHLRAQFEATRPLLDILLQAYPQYLERSWFEYDKYVWAAELWYSYAFEIEFPPSPKSRTVMVPFACHVNHSPWPHCVRYGRINPSTCTLDYPAFRPCPKGAQTFISYGPVPNLKLLSYYGFALAENPHDQVPLTLEAPDGGLTEAQTHALSIHGIGMEHSLHGGPLAKQLLACIRLVVATQEEVQKVVDGTVNPLEGPLSKACEMQALETLLVVLKDLLAPVQEGLANVEEMMVARQGPAGNGSSVERNENGFDSSWQTSLGFCKAYLEGQQRVLRLSMEQCQKLIAAEL